MNLTNSKGAFLYTSTVGWSLWICEVQHYFQWWTIDAYNITTRSTIHTWDIRQVVMVLISQGAFMHHSWHVYCLQFSIICTNDMFIISSAVCHDLDHLYWFQCEIISKCERRLCDLLFLSLVCVINQCSSLYSSV